MITLSFYKNKEIFIELRNTVKEIIKKILIELVDFIMQVQTKYIYITSSPLK